MIRHKQLVSRVAALALLAIGSAAHTASSEVKQGKQLFEQNCQVCHQADAIGKPGFAPSLTNKELLSIGSDKFFMSTIRDGRTGTGMPPFAHLGKKKINSIVVFLRSHETSSNRAKKVDAQRESFGDARKGELWFKQICVACHGDRGEGYGAGVVGTAIGKSGFLNKVSDGFIRETIKYGRSNTRMRGFSGTAGLANLRDSEIEDVIAYLRTLGNKGNRAR
ncbi:Cytochrome c oxidase subunit CcoP [hydrothermal vent metagenome]|uniref:Cytochrome c oxidase subunit CcoP n=1 Tax=hydrothermal vent metagenome TaxID=652676 RepID=A0A3B1B5L1_9ZZZZ